MKKESKKKEKITNSLFIIKLLYTLSDKIVSFPDSLSVIDTIPLPSLLER